MGADIAILRDKASAVIVNDRPAVTVIQSGFTADFGRALRTITGESFPEIDKTDFIAQYWVGDAVGNPIPSAGTVTGGDATLRTDLANFAAGGHIVGFKNSGTGAIARTVSDKLTDTASVKDFGAVGNGIADDYAAFAAAVASGRKRIFVPGGSYNLSQSLDPPSGVTIELSDGAVLTATGAGAGFPWLFNISAGKSNIKIIGGTMTPGSTGDAYRAAIQAKQCTHLTFRDVIVQGASDSNGIMLWDSDACVIDNLYFDGGALKHGTAAYLIGTKGCSISDSKAYNCFAGFAFAGQETDPASTRTTAQSFGNSMTLCYVNGCTTQSFDVIGSVGNLFIGCSAENYAGTGTHKAFQVKDTVGDPTRANVFIGCTAKDYPAGFGGQQGSHAKFLGCTGQNLSTNGIELNSCTAFSFVGCSMYEFAQAGVWTGGGTIRCIIDVLNLETSTATATGILLSGSGGNDSNNEFNSVVTASTLAKFIDIASNCSNNRFDRGCRTGGNPVVDASGTAEWPVLGSSPVVPLNALSKNYLQPYIHRGMNVVAARLIVTTTIAGTTSPQISIGRDGSPNIIAAPQVVTGAATAVVPLALTASPIYANAQIPTWNVTTAAAGTGAAGAGYVQIEGFLAN